MFLYPIFYGVAAARVRVVPVHVPVSMFLSTTSTNSPVEKRRLGGVMGSYMKTCNMTQLETSLSQYYLLLDRFNEKISITQHLPSAFRHIKTNHDIMKSEITESIKLNQEVQLLLSEAERLKILELLNNCQPFTSNNFNIKRLENNYSSMLYNSSSFSWSNDLSNFIYFIFLCCIFCLFHSTSSKNV